MLPGLGLIEQDPRIAGATRVVTPELSDYAPKKLLLKAAIAFSEFLVRRV